MSIFENSCCVFAERAVNSLHKVGETGKVDVNMTRVEQIRWGKVVVMSTLTGVKAPVTEACLVDQLMKQMDRMLADEVLGWLEAAGQIFETKIDARRIGYGLHRAWTTIPPA